MQSEKAKGLSLVCIYLGAIVVANLIAARLGPTASIFNAFVLIGLDLTSRDALHEQWHNRGLVWKMALLIASGSAISYLLNRGAGQIALASMVAFGCAAIVDTAIYHLLRDKTRLVKINGSNIFSAVVDSLLFPTIAFGGFMPVIMLGQFAAKFSGGFIWSIILGIRK